MCIFFLTQKEKRKRRVDGYGLSRPFSGARKIERKESGATVSGLHYIARTWTLFTGHRLGTEAEGWVLANPLQALTPSQ